MDGYKKTIGRFGESLAKDFLSRRGYKIIGTNLRFGRLEIDLVARLKKQTIFIEVKTRQAASVGPAEDALKLSQIKDLKRAITAYCYHKNVNVNDSQLDFIAIDLNRARKTAKIKHFKNIF